MPTTNATKTAAKRPAKKAARKPAKKRTTRSDFARIMAGLQKGEQPIKKTKPTQYLVEASFVADRPMSREEIRAIEGQLTTVMEEPTDDWAVGVPDDHMSFRTTGLRVRVRSSRQRRK